MSSFADLDVIKMDYIGCVADILGPDPSTPEDSIPLDELPEPSIEENIAEDDFQTLVEEMQKPEIPLTESTQFNDWNQLTPPLSPPSPTTLNLPQSEFPTLNVTESPVFSDTSMDKELTIHEEVICQEEFEKEILSLTTQEDEEANLGSENLISAEFAKYAISAVFVPPLERTRQATKTLYVMPKESKEISSSPTISASCEQRFSEKASPKVPTTPKVDIAKIRSAAFGGPVEDIVFYKDEYKEEYGKFFKISICNFI